MIVDCVVVGDDWVVVADDWVIVADRCIAYDVAYYYKNYLNG